MTNTTHSARQNDNNLAMRSLLWILLVVTLAANATTSVMGLNPFISIGFGLATLASGVALVAHYRRAR